MSTTFLRGRPTLGVRDVATSLDFYTGALGFGVIVSMGEPPNFAIVSRDAVGLGVVQTEAPAVAEFACCYFDVDDVEALHQRCVDAGARIVAPLTRQPWGNYDFVVADPDGHLLACGEVPARA
jgi:catechol 2,3-dioxygenase-like lactoylglutathione lyase family enzyme